MPTTTKTAERRRGGGAGVSRSTRLLLLTVSLLSAAVAVRTADPFDRVNGTRLAAIADGFRRDWPTTRARSGQVKMRLRPHGEPSSWPTGHAVCGYDFTAEAAAVDVTRTRHLPAASAFLCGDGRDEYRVGLPAAENASAAYETIAFLGEGAHVATVRLETAGETAVPLTDLCFGFVDDDATVRAFCADVELLIACRRWKGLADNLDFGFNYVQLMAKRRYSVREIVFHDVRALPGAFESLTRDPADEAAARDVCQRIGFTDSASRTHEGCLGRLVSSAADDGASGREFKFNRKGLLVDAADDSYACERSSSAQSEPDDNASLPTSGGRALFSPSDNGFLFLFSFISILLKSVVV